ncbi:hypothetical protein CAI21_14940 [Alkalilimnicola ehrlichii]|uniref:YknX-like C-terminal permuted SH3-like domain-containing protein n=1 Tax=Alkalilimnicola ehrlichii TaxID=351052 RepID=A0A3E0WQG4_9GAMM|nr:HlyD family efflux transporter periplasmic adaptor subunit [Alkalilimnicola ehrlichii]RFA27326.1 hypothetical protein CAI21_14940 [Alkalilimnicola ehrlichii]RFA34433.1 hypothetical protein CAL65_15510 [Alkalilimnicola ehrlichii]
MSSRKRIVIFLIGAFVVLLLALAFRPRPILVDTAVVERAPLVVTVDRQGVSRVQDRYVVSAPVTGHLQRIGLRVGDSVEQGEVVARIAPAQPAPLDARARAEAEASLDRAESRVEQAGAQREAAAAVAELAERRYDRVRRQLAADDVAEIEFEQARAAVLEARANLRSAEFNRDIARHELAAAQALLREWPAEASGPRKTVTITAPVGGRLLALRRQSEGVVSAGEPLLDIGDPAVLEIAVDVLSADAVRLRPGMAVRILRWGGEDLQAAVRTIEPAGFTEVSALGVEEQRVTVIADLLSPGEQWERLGDDYHVDASFILWQDDETLQVPEGAVFRRAEGWASFVVIDGRAELRPVRIGRRADLRAQIVDGLEPGEVVIVHPAPAIEAGSRVAPR